MPHTPLKYPSECVAALAATYIQLQGGSVTQALHTQRAPSCCPLRANRAAHDGTGADVQSKDQKKKNTPLHVACEKGFVDCIKLLAEAGADLSVRNKAGELFSPGESHAARRGLQQLLIGTGLELCSGARVP